MGWFQAVVAGLVVTIIGLGIRIENPVVHYFSSQGLQGVLEEDEGLCFPTLFSFGSSVADTGTQSVAFPSYAPQNDPYGSTFFGKPAGRYSDGRINIDFWASALRIPLLKPYLKSVGSNFRRGANFAASGSTGCNDTTFSPFPLSTQLYHFREFKRDVLAIRNTGSRASSAQNSDDQNKLPLKEDFEGGLYIIAIGGNDLLKWIVIDRLSVQEVELRIPKISEEILRVVEALYAEGARHVLVEDVFPQGCAPYFLLPFAAQYAHELDAVGCLKPINGLVQLHNSLLKKGVLELGKRLPDASISFVDTYSRRYHIIANHDQYGFKEPIRACCGSGGEYNYRSDCPCGESIIENGVLIRGGSCDNVSSHALWDSIHFTEAFNRVTMKGILAGKYFEPRFDVIRNGCTLADI